MKLRTWLFTLVWLVVAPAAVLAAGTFTHYPSSTTALAYDGEYFWIGLEENVLKWDKNAGILAEYTPDDGLPGASIDELYAAPGNTEVWAVTASGIARFDGASWHTFTEDEGAPYASLGDAAFPQDGTFWILTSDGKGVYRCEGNAWTHFTTADGLADDTVNAIAVDHEGVVWVGTDNGVSAYDGSAWTTYTTADGLADNDVVGIVVGADNVKWFGVGGETGGVARFDGTAWSSYNMANGLIDAKEINDMATGPDNSVYVSLCDIRHEDTYEYKTSGAGKPANPIISYYAYLYKFSESEITLLRSQITAGYAVSSSYNPLLIDNSGNLHVISDIPSNKAVLGLYRKGQLCDIDNLIWFIECGSYGFWLASYDGEYRHQRGFGPPSDISTLAVGNKNEVWVGNSQGGIAEFTDNEWNAVPYEDSDFINIYCMAADGEGALWIGLDNLRLMKFQWGENKWDEYDYKGYTSYLPNTVRSLAFDDDRTLWMGFGSTGDGVFSYDGSAWTQYNAADGLIDDNVTAVAVDASNAKWFGTSAGISRFDGASWASFTTAADGDSLGTICALAAGRNGVIWAGTDNGLLYYDGSSWTRFTTADGLADTRVRSLAVTSGGVVWAGTLYGLSRFDGTTWTTYTAADGLPDNNVQALAAGSDDMVWIGTGEGLASCRETGIWTSVDGESAKPSAFPAVAVYPNPFNPLTTIEFSIPADSRVTLTIFNITGQRVAELVNEKLPAGRHSVVWNAEGMPSGVYFCTVMAGDTTETRKMLLLK